ncbi:uncharacterized protein C18orf19 homolog A [Toxorhynchites rutilus septentrionalis]|uniref:uncharacterized protein C18orf19 homolog A n=1 Tax=Toxorhynchites rutilus septentrionalis TaxID=329112 RepID=UPI00247962B2|nr:uncharacterized protein C18orf19 homolog A [Toxorhynchites rutilus septentrionalis]
MSLLLNSSRMVLAGSMTRSIPIRFSTHPQFRNVLTVCSNNFHCWSRPQEQSGSICYRQFPVCYRQQTPFFSSSTYQMQQHPSSDKKSHPSTAQSELDNAPEEPVKLGLFARFKKMYKEYWYVLVPVHCITSVFWFGGFYYASTSGVDVIAILESMGVSQKLIDPVRDSSLGHIAIAYLLYKIATPVRYTVTLGGSTISIKYLVQLGYIKPIPSKDRLVQMYKDKKENIQERIAERKQDFQDKMAEKKQGIQDKIAEQKQSIQERKQQLEKRKQSIMDDYQQFKSGIKKGEDTMGEK